jgi:hypothetical protein
MNHSDLKTIEFAAYIGLDWADQKHDICLQENVSHQVESLRLDHKPDAISNWVADAPSRGLIISPIQPSTPAAAYIVP